MLGFALFSAWWMLHMKALTGNPLFPYFNEYWHSPLALAAPYRDLRFVPTHFWREAFLSGAVFDRLACRRRSGLSGYPRLRRLFRGDRGASLLWLSRRQSRDPLIDKRVTPAAVCLRAVSYFVWLQILRHLSLHRRAWKCWRPLLIVAAVGLLPAARGARAIWRWRRCAFAVLVTARSDFLERAPVDDPYIQVALPPIPHPDNDHGADDRRRADGLHRTLAAAPDSRAADGWLDGAAQRRHPADHAT